MSRSSKRNSVWGRVLGALTGIALVVAGGVYVDQVISTDPFKVYRNNRDQVTQSQPAIILTNVSIRHYEGARLAGTAKVGRVEVGRDRKTMQCFAVTDGVYYAKNDNAVTFTAKQGVWASDTHTFLADQGVNVKSKNFDLNSSSFVYNQQEQKLTVPTSITGAFYDGKITTDSVIYTLPTDEYIIGPVVWVGQLDSPTQEGATKRVPWTIRTTGPSSGKGDLQTWNNAEATDGDVIVKADKLERNKKTDVIVATGKVRYYSAKTNLICDKATIFRGEKRAVLEGNVQAFIKPEDQQVLEVVELQPVRPIVPDEIAQARPSAPATGEQKQAEKEVRSTDNKRKYPVTVFATRIEYWYAKGNRHAIISGSPQARQELPAGQWRQVWCSKAFYDGEVETLKLTSTEGKKDTRVRTSIGDDMQATWFEISTKEGQDDWSGEGIEGVVFPDEDEVPKAPGDDKSKGGKKPPPGGLQGPIGGRGGGR